MLLTAEEFRQIAAQAEAEYPAECCGLILVRDGPATDRRVVPCRNVQDALHARDPDRHPRTARTAFRVDDGDLYRALRMEEQGYRVAVIYHSHIDAGAYFSETDKRNALGQSGPLLGQPLYPGAVHVVLSVVEGKVAAAAAFAWDEAGRDFLPVPLAVPA
jgi:proteasome lid subunit RPN8/RPN11